MARFTAQADTAALPLVLYNVHRRTVIDLQVDPVAALALHPRIVGIKDATGDIARAAGVAQAVPPGFAQYSGDESTSLPYLALGGKGVISVVANILPAEVAALCAYMNAGRLHEARALVARLLPLTPALFMESSPARPSTRRICAACATAGCACRSARCPHPRRRRCAPRCIPARKPDRAKNNCCPRLMGKHLRRFPSNCRPCQTLRFGPGADRQRRPLLQRAFALAAVAIPGWRG